MAGHEDDEEAGIDGIEESNQDGADSYIAVLMAIIRDV